MRLQELELRRLMLNEAVGCDTHADELAELAEQEIETLHGSALFKLARLHRVRAIELRSQAMALATQAGPADYTEA